MSSSVDPQEAARQLAGLETFRAEIARRAVAPWWYHPSIGVLVGSMIAMLAAPLLWRLVHLAFVFGGAFLLARVSQRRTGVKFNEWRRGPTRWVSAGVAASVLSVGLACVAIVLFFDGHPLVYLVGSLIAALIVSAAGPLTETVFRRQSAEDGRS